MPIALVTRDRSATNIVVGIMLNIQVAHDRQRIWAAQAQYASCYEEAVQRRVKAGVVPRTRSNGIGTTRRKRKGHGAVLCEIERSTFDAPGLHAAAICSRIYVECHMVGHHCELAIGNSSSPPIGRGADISVVDGMGDGLLRPSIKTRQK